METQGAQLAHEAQKKIRKAEKKQRQREEAEAQQTARDSSSQNWSKDSREVQGQWQLNFLAAERERLEGELVRNAQLVARVQGEIEQHALRKRDRKRLSLANIKRDR